MKNRITVLTMVLLVGVLSFTLGGKLANSVDKNNFTISCESFWDGRIIKQYAKVEDNSLKEFFYGSGTLTNNPHIDYEQYEEEMRMQSGSDLLYDWFEDWKEEKLCVIK